MMYYTKVNIVLQPFWNDIEMRSTSVVLMNNSMKTKKTVYVQRVSDHTSFNYIRVNKKHFIFGSGLRCCIYADVPTRVIHNTVRHTNMRIPEHLSYES